VQVAASEILGTSDAIRSLRSYLPKVARSEAPALITGSTGTGKEHVARCIHRLSGRVGKPFVALNCAAIPDTLFEAELFGFERGSFTGANHAQKGKAVLADRGTLFLDEIGELSPLAQSKLLRLLEEREVQPIGAPRPVKVDFRVIAATNRDLDDGKLDGRFRSDLYYRLNVARIALPDLAERPEDIPVYIDHFVDAFNRRSGKQVTGADHDLLEVLMAYDWPGNVREIRNFIEAVFIDPPDRLIGLHDIPEAFRHLRRGYIREGEEEQRRIIAALERTNWNKVEAARILRWSRMTLYRKLSKYNVSSAGGPDGDRMR
jgi:two-component system response regulator HydG